jgi:hypothetical protein
MPLIPISLFGNVEGLRRVVMEAKRVRIVSRVIIGMALSLTHPLFVDDFLLFSNGSVREVRKVHKILDTYGTTTCMEFNVLKYSIFFTGLEQEVEQRLIRIFPLNF